MEQSKRVVLTKPTFVNMEELQPGNRVTMHLRVHSVKITRQRQRYDGESLNLVAECIVGDEFGCAKLIANDKQLEVIKEGAIITIRNAHAKVVKEHMRIELDKWAKVEPSRERIGKVNTGNNKSDIEYELVPIRKE